MDSAQKKTPAQKENESPSEDIASQPRSSKTASDTLLSVTAGIESDEVVYDPSKETSLELSMSEVIPVVNSECTEESEVPPSTDLNDSLGDISEHFFESEQSVTAEMEKSQRFAEENDSCKGSDGKPENLHRGSSDNGIEIQSDESKTSKSKQEIVSLEAEDPRETSAKELKKDQFCQANCLPEKTRSEEVKILMEKLAISKKDTETMQKLLEDVRKDYEELQKNFEKRESEIKSKAFSVEEVMKESGEMKKEKAELNRKTSKKEGKVSATSDEKYSGSKPSEKKKQALEKGSVNSRERVDSTDLTCPCFAQNIRRIITDVTEDFKDAISLIKQSSSEQRESIGMEFAKLKDEYICSLEKKDCEIQAFEETIKGLQSRIREAERELADYRSVISSACEEKQKLYDDIRGLKDELVKAQHESARSRADLEKIKYGLKKYCTAEEYEELQRLNFNFGDEKEAGEGTSARQSDSNSDVTELRNKVAKFYPVLKKAKKDITKLKETKQEVENRFKAKITQAAEKEKHFNKKLTKAASNLKESEGKIAALTAQLEEMKLENTKLRCNIDELEGQAEEIRRQHLRELRMADDKIKVNNEKLLHFKGKYDELKQDHDDLKEDHEVLRGRFNDVKKCLEVARTKEVKEIADDSSDEGSSGHLLKGESALRKALEAEKEKNEKWQREIEMLKKDVDLWKEIASDERLTSGTDEYLKMTEMENEELKQEMREQQGLIDQLISKTKEYIVIIKKLRVQNAFLQRKALSEQDIFFPDSDDEPDSERPGDDGTSTQEHRVRFDKNGKMENVKQSECSDEEEDSLFVQFSDANNDLYLAEIREYDTSVSEKE